VIDRRIPLEDGHRPRSGEHIERRGAKRIAERSEHRRCHHRVADVIAPHHQHALLTPELQNAAARE